MGVVIIRCSLYVVTTSSENLGRRVLRYTRYGQMEVWTYIRNSNRLIILINLICIALYLFRLVLGVFMGFKLGFKADLWDGDQICIVIEKSFGRSKFRPIDRQRKSNLAVERDLTGLRFPKPRFDQRSWSLR